MLLYLVVEEAHLHVRQPQSEGEQSRRIKFGYLLDVVCIVAHLILLNVVGEEEHRLRVDSHVVVLNASAGLVFIFCFHAVVGFHGEQGVELVHHSRFALYLLGGLRLVGIR